MRTDTSVLGAIEIPTPPASKSKSEKGTAQPVASKFTRRHQKTKDLIAHVKAKTAAKTAARKSTKPVLETITRAAHKVAVHKAVVKKILKGEEPVKQGAKSNIGACSVCGKSLSRGSSISQGMGDVCAHRGSLLPKGVSYEQHMADMKVVELPSGYLKLGEVMKAAKKAGYPPTRVVVAAGGNGGLHKPLNEHFRMVFFKGARYLPGTSVKHLTDLEVK